MTDNERPNRTGTSEPISAAAFMQRHAPDDVVVDDPPPAVRPKVQVDLPELLPAARFVPRAIHYRTQLDSLIFGVVAAWVLLAFTRLGGQFITDPTAGLRFVVLGLWGLLAVAGLVGLAAHFLSETPLPPWQVVALAAASQTGLIAVGFITFLAGNAMEILGPGWFAAIVVGVGWMPYVLVVGFNQLTNSGWARSALVGLGVQLLWLLTLGRYVVDRIGHLL